MARVRSTIGGPYFHGGIPGLEVGDELLPRHVTGNGTPESRWAEIFADLPREEWKEIFVTLSLPIASWFATRWPGGGDVYAVAVEPTDPPPRAAGAIHLRTRSAVVCRVIWRGVTEPYPLEKPGGRIERLTPAEPRTDLRRFKPIRRRSNFQPIERRSDG